MSDDSDITQSPEDLSKAHIQELIEKGKAEYRVFGLIDALGLEEAETAAIREALVAVVEVNITEDLRQGDSIHGTARSLLDSTGVDIAAMFQAWRRCVEAAMHDRKAMKALCADFGSVMDALPNEDVDKSLEFVVGMIQHHKRDALQMIRSPVAGLMQSLPSDKRRKWLDFLMPYLPVALPKPLQGLVRISAVLFGRADEGLVETFAENCPAQALEDNREVEPFLVKCAATLDSLPPDSHLPYVRLSIRVASQSFGSASAVAVGLRKKIGAIEECAAGHYLDCFARIVESASIRAVGFCLGPLHKLFTPTPVAGVDGLVDAICQVGERYGASAAQAFMEKRTDASRRSWPKP